MKKDATIQKIFDDYAESIQLETHLCAKAKQAMTARSSKSVWKIPAVVCGALAVVLVFAVLIANLPHDLPSSVYLYNMGDVRGKEVSEADVADALPINALRQQPQFSVVSARYFAFCFKESGNEAYVRAFLGIATPNGMVELSLIAEKSEYLREDLSGFYKQNLKNANGLVVLEREDLPGEYAASAYLESNGLRFYISTQGNVATKEDTKNILNLFV